MRLWVKSSWIVALCFGSNALGCAGGAPLPGAASAASPQAEEAPARSVATSLTRDPLSEEPGPVPGHSHPHAAAAPPAPGPTPPAADGGVPEGTEYVCPMHPDVREPKPGRCPRCGMALVPKPIGAPGPAPKPQEDHEHAH